MKGKTIEQIRELEAKTPSGWNLDSTALYAPFRHGDEYPQFWRVVEQNEDGKTVEFLKFIRFWDKTAQYETEKVFYPAGRSCGYCGAPKKIESATRFDFKRLCAIAESL